MSTFYEFKKFLSDKFHIPLFKLQVFNSRQDEVRLESYFKSMNEMMLTSGKFEIMENY